MKIMNHDSLHSVHMKFFIFTITVYYIQFFSAAAHIHFENPYGG